MQNFRAFWDKNKVFIIGAVSALLMAIYEITSKGDEASPWVLGWSGAIAVLTFFQRNLRGQWASICLTLASCSIAFFNLHNSPADLTFRQIANELILPVAIQLAGVWSGPAKPREYEHATPIVEAKIEAQQIIEAKKEAAKAPDDKPPIKYTSPEQK